MKSVKETICNLTEVEISHINDLLCEYCDNNDIYYQADVLNDAFMFNESVICKYVNGDLR